MANHYEGETNGHRSAGYALAGHPAESGSYGDLDRGYCSAASVLCCPDIAGIYSPAAGRGDYCGKGQRGSIREETNPAGQRI